MRLTLHTPFRDLAGQTRTYLDLRDVLTGGDVLYSRRQKSADDVERSYHLLARVAGLDIRELEEMDVRDIAAIDAHVAEIQSPKADPTPSGS